MPGIMFQDVVSLRTRSHRKWYTLPLSFVVHTTVLAVLVAVPLIATDIPRPREIIQYVTPYMPVIPTAPPSIRRASPTPASGNAAGAPVVAPDSIGVESGVIFEPGHVETAGIDSLDRRTRRGPHRPRCAADLLRPRHPRPSSVGGNIKPPTRTNYVLPEYPALARSLKDSKASSSSKPSSALDGRVEQARVLRSKPLLDEAALAAVREWEYTPTLLNGRPTRVIMTVTVNYTLNPC